MCYCSEDELVLLQIQNEKLLKYNINIIVLVSSKVYVTIATSILKLNICSSDDNIIVNNALNFVTPDKTT